MPGEVAVEQVRRLGRGFPEGVDRRLGCVSRLVQDAPVSGMALRQPVLGLEVEHPVCDQPKGRGLGRFLLGVGCRGESHHHVDPGGDDVFSVGVDGRLPEQ